MNYGPRCFFCKLVEHFESDSTQLSDAVADAKHTRREEALFGLKTSRACLMNKAESRKKKTSQDTFAMK